MEARLAMPINSTYFVHCLGWVWRSSRPLLMWAWPKRHWRGMRPPSQVLVPTILPCPYWGYAPFITSLKLFFFYPTPGSINSAHGYTRGYQPNLVDKESVVGGWEQLERTPNLPCWKLSVYCITIMIVVGWCGKLVTWLNFLLRNRSHWTQTSKFSVMSACRADRLNSSIAQGSWWVNLQRHDLLLL